MWCLKNPQLWITLIHAFSLAFPFSNTEILFGLRYKDWLFWFIFLVSSLYIQVQKSLMFCLESNYLFVLLMKQQVSCEEQEFGRQPNLALSSYKSTCQCAMLSKSLNLPDQNEITPTSQNCCEDVKMCMCVYICTYVCIHIHIYFYINIYVHIDDT